jgi:hypothetical protein
MACRGVREVWCCSPWVAVEVEEATGRLVGDVDARGRPVDEEDEEARVAAGLGVLEEDQDGEEVR